MYTDPLVFALALAKQQEAQERALNYRAAREARTARGVQRPTTSRRAWRRLRRRRGSAEAGGAA